MAKPTCAASTKTSARSATAPRLREVRGAIKQSRKWHGTVQTGTAHQKLEVEDRRIGILCCWLALSATSMSLSKTPQSRPGRRRVCSGREQMPNLIFGRRYRRVVGHAPSSKRSRISGSWSCCMHVPNAAALPPHPLGQQLDKNAKGDPRINSPRPFRGADASIRVGATS